METPTTVEAYFDPTNGNWSPNDMNNFMFLRMTMNHAQAMLKVRGHVFVNDLFDLLGLKRQPSGQLVGWLYERGDKVVYEVEHHDDKIVLRFHTHGDIHQSI